MTDPLIPLASPLLIGFGITGKAVAASLVQRGVQPVVVEDRPGPRAAEEAERLGVMLLAAPSHDQLEAALAQASVLLPSPGVPDHHPAFALAQTLEVPVHSEFDLAGEWDDRPILAITGTNGKTSVTMMVTDALTRSGIRAEAVGNTDVPLVAALDNPAIDAFVVEASSFRLGHSQHFAPRVGAWLNFAPDHLDAHRSLEAYELAKASIWSHLESGSIAIANADDAVVMSHVDRAADRGARLERFSLQQRAEWWVDGSRGLRSESELFGPDGPFLTVGDLRRRQPHEVANALATAAIASAGGAAPDAVAGAISEFAGLPHRLEHVGTSAGVDWYNDSKATVPQATAVAVSGFSSVILIAGGRNKGLSMEPLRSTVPPVRVVIAIGDAADEVACVYRGLVDVDRAESMEDAVVSARKKARAGDAVILSPACTSFDWYPNYAERGRDFTQLVQKKVLGS